MWCRRGRPTCGRRRPIEPAIRDGRMYGRGAGDMKAGIASYLTAFKALRLAGLQPAAEVQMQSVIEEECTRQWRARRHAGDAADRCGDHPRARPGRGGALYRRGRRGLGLGHRLRPAGACARHAGRAERDRGGADHRRALQGLRECDERRRAHPPGLPRRQPSGERQPRHHRGRRVEFLGRHPLPHRPAGRGDDGLYRGADQGRYRGAGGRGRSSTSGCAARW